MPTDRFDSEVRIAAQKSIPMQSVTPVSPSPKLSEDFLQGTLLYHCFIYTVIAEYYSQYSFFMQLHF